jgi:hypothetical protein
VFGFDCHDFVDCLGAESQLDHFEHFLHFFCYQEKRFEKPYKKLPIFFKNKFPKRPNNRAKRIFLPTPRRPIPLARSNPNSNSLSFPAGTRLPISAVLLRRLEIGA